MSENHLETLERHLRGINPSKTGLIVGAGAAVTSGAPLGAELAQYIRDALAPGETIADDLAELGSIVEQRSSRKELMDCVRARLASLSPDQALVTLASYRWTTIYSTNYDQLIESAHAAANAPIAIVRSHFDWENAHATGATILFKIHGCVTQDRAYGDRASMILTLEDYDSAEKYRELVYGRLKLELAGRDTWIIGHSLRDRDLQSLVLDAIRLQRESGAPGRIHLLVSEYDEERATVWRARGLHTVARGSINDFVYCLSRSHQPNDALPRAPAHGAPALPHQLTACTIRVAPDPARRNPRRLYAGATATYDDISAGLTFPRDSEARLIASNRLVRVITGAAGLGKSTLARRIASAQHSVSGTAFEHRPEYPFDPLAWMAYEAELRRAGATAVLLIDNCTPFLRQINRLMQRLPHDSHLRLILTAETSVWRIRQKDPRLFSEGTEECLGALSRKEVRALRDLVLSVPALKELVDREFVDASYAEQEHILWRKCSADMFVCLKVLFSSDSLDEILLREFAGIEEPFSNIYRTTAAVEAAGGLPHRQMILRLTGLSPSLIEGSLDVLEGVIEEHEQEASRGIYLWYTRHEVIARTLTKYKYSDAEEFRTLLLRIIQSANPTYFEEARTLREMCNSRSGIRALPERSHRLELYRAIVESMPTERVARHRLVSELLEAGSLGEAEGELKRSVEEVGLDPPLQRFRVRLLVVRSRADGLQESDRRALLKFALREAELGIEEFADNKYQYFVAADVAEEWFRLTGERGLLEWAKLKLSAAAEEILDPELSDRIAHLGRL